MKISWAQVIPMVGICVMGVCASLRVAAQQGQFPHKPSGSEAQLCVESENLDVTFAVQRAVFVEECLYVVLTDPNRQFAWREGLSGGGMRTEAREIARVLAPQVLRELAEKESR